MQIMSRVLLVEKMSEIFRKFKLEMSWFEAIVKLSVLPTKETDRNSCLKSEALKAFCHIVNPFPLQT